MLWQGNITAGVSAQVDDPACLDALPLGITVIAVALQQVRVCARAQAAAT